MVRGFYSVLSPQSSSLFFKSLLLQAGEQFLEAAGAGRADAAFGGAEGGGDVRVGGLLGLVEEHGQELPAALVDLGEGGADEVLLFESRERLVGQRRGVGDREQLVGA